MNVRACSHQFHKEVMEYLVPSPLLFAIASRGDE